MKHALVDFYKYMQSGLFDNQTPSQPATESYGTTARRALKREFDYQIGKRENESLQKNWLAGKTNRMNESETRRNEISALNNAEPITVVLVSCVSKKAATASKAKDVYISDWFRKARVYAERVGDKWMILSAHHELLDPETVIDPYNKSLYGQRKAEREAWATRIADRLRSQIPPRSRIVILAGDIYREFLISKLEDKFTIEVPLKSLGIGEQLSYLKKVNQNG